MSRLTQPGATAPIDLFQTNSNPGGTYNYADPSFITMTGMRFQAQDGRWFAIVQNGATALDAGHLVAGPAPTADHEGLTTVSFTAYSSNGNQPPQVKVTLGATEVYANEYQGGYLQVKSGAGIGQLLQIASHPAAAASADVVITLADSPAVDLSATSVVDLIRNPYGSQYGASVDTNGVVVSPTTFAGQVVGSVLYTIPASTSSFASYGLIQTTGVASVIANAAVPIGAAISPSTSTAGEIEQTAVGTSVVSTAVIGYAVQAGVAGDSQMVYLQL